MNMVFQCSKDALKIKSPDKGQEFDYFERPIFLVGG
jgi:hypothetical protein